MSDTPYTGYVAGFVHGMYAAMVAMGATMPEDEITIIPDPTRQQLYSMYWKEKLSMPEIGKRTGYSPTGVKKRMARYGIPTRTNTSPEQRETLRIVERAPLTSAQIASWLGLGTHSAYMRLNRLAKAGKVVMRDGCWYLVKDAGNVDD